MWFFRCEHIFYFPLDEYRGKGIAGLEGKNVHLTL